MKQVKLQQNGFAFVDLDNGDRISCGWYGEDVGYSLSLSQKGRYLFFLVENKKRLSTINKVSMERFGIEFIK